MADPVRSDAVQIIREALTYLGRFGSAVNTGPTKMSAASLAALDGLAADLKRAIFVGETNDQGYRDMRKHYDKRLAAADADLEQTREALRREDAEDESRCHFCQRVTRPWVTTDETWRLVESVLGQNQACVVCFYEALEATGNGTAGEPLVVLRPPALAAGSVAPPDGDTT